MVTSYSSVFPFRVRRSITCKFSSWNVPSPSNQVSVSMLTTSMTKVSPSQKAMESPSGTASRSLLCWPPIGTTRNVWAYLHYCFRPHTSDTWLSAFEQFPSEHQCREPQGDSNRYKHRRS